MMDFFHQKGREKICFGRGRVDSAGIQVLEGWMWCYSHPVLSHVT